MSVRGMMKYRNFIKSILLMLLLLPATGWSQSSVTLYGIMDGGLLYTTKSLNPVTGQNGGKQFEVISSGMDTSMFGLTGVEDLGGGAKVQFKLASGISIANGGFANSNLNLFGQQAWVAFSNSLGQVKIGQQFSPFILAVYDIDPRGASLFGSAFTVYADNTFTGSFVSNAITYTTPKIAGFVASAMYTLGGVAGDFAAGRSYSASIEYDNGSLIANAAIEDSSESRDAVENDTLFVAPVEARMVGLGYRFSSLVVKGSFTNFKAPMNILDGYVGGGDNYIWNVGLDFFVTPQLDFESGVYYSKDPHIPENHGLLAAVGASYLVSRRTTLYAQVGFANNHGRSDLGLYLDGAQGAPGTTVGYSLGITQKF